MSNFISNPVICPEVYYDPRLVRSLHISFSISQRPTLITDTYQNALSCVFSSRDTRILHPHPDFFICFEPLLQHSIYFPNYVATQLLRNCFSTYFGSQVSDSVYGDVLIFGSYNYKEKCHDEEHHSVPYQIVEEVTKLYEKAVTYVKVI